MDLMREHGPVLVQHRIAAEADEVGALLDAGARVLVCGDGSRTAPGVREALRALLAEGHPDRGPGRGLDDLIASGRYVEDVRAAG
jgi:cytochrome P450 / NADPH-cytochrome P450 reductase